MIELNQESLLERIKYLDRDAFLKYDNEGKFHVVLVGGGALILMGYIARSTHDLDVIRAAKELHELFEKYDMNCRVLAHENSFPYNFEDRLKPLWSGKKIDFYTASLEDIVIAKLCADRPQDKQDLIAVAPFVDWKALETFALDENEAKASALNDRNYSDFLYTYSEYKRRFHP